MNPQMPFPILMHSSYKFKIKPGKRVELIRQLRHLLGISRSLAWCISCADSGIVNTEDFHEDPGQGYILKSILGQFVCFIDDDAGNQNQKETPDKLKQFSLPEAITDDKLEEFAAHLEQIAALIRNIDIMKCAYATVGS